MWAKEETLNGKPEVAERFVVASKRGIAGLPIFPHYSFDLSALYGAVDGQKFGVERPTVKARHSRKYFGRGKGVVAYTLLSNHVPLQGWLIERARI